jgi:type IV pilus assembly protein PilP
MKTPLQRFELGQLKLVGVIWEASEPKALIEDSGGLGYIVTRGTLIGSNGGIIKAIESKRVVVEEYHTDFFGKRQAQERELQLFVTESSSRGGTTKKAK